MRAGPRDPGVYTELKTIENNSSTAVAKNIRRGATQLDDVGGGQIVIDGRGAGLTEAVARDGWRRALDNMANAREAPPESVRVLLPDGEVRFP